MTIHFSNFKHCLGSFAKGVTIVTCNNLLGENIGITVDSFNSVSLSPPLILFSVNKAASSHDTFINAENFLINILNSEQSHLSKEFSMRHHENKWQNVNYSISALTKNRIIEDCICYLECEKYAIYPGGDHSIVVGKVINLSPILLEKRPLIYFRGSYCTI